MIEFRRIPVEQRSQVSLRPRAAGSAAETHKSKRGALAVARVGDQGLLESRDRTRAITEHFTQFAKHEPGRRISRYQLDRLHHEVGSSGKIALGLPVARPFEAAIGNHITG
jgi:hypothetical protein